MDFNHVRPEHVCHPVEKVAEKHRQALQTLSEALDEKQAEAEKSLKIVTDAKMALKIAADNAKEEISKQKNEIIKEVEDVYQKKVNEVDNMYANREEKLSGQQNKVNSILKKVKCACNLSKNVLQKGSDEEIIESQNLVQEQLEAVKKDFMDIQGQPKPVGVDKKWYPPKQMRIDMISKLFGRGILLCFFQPTPISNKTHNHNENFSYFKILTCTHLSTYLFIYLLSFIEHSTRSTIKCLYI